MLILFIIIVENIISEGTYCEESDKNYIFLAK